MATQEKIETIRNILIVGRTGGGKSTLSNVLSNSSEFKENNYSSGGSRNYQKTTFTWNGTKYRVVDTPGIGSIDITKDKISEIVKEISSLMPEGISQVLFVVDGKFTAEEIRVFDLFKQDIFNSGIAKFTTIVRTKFNNFKNIDYNKLDKIKLFMENEIIAKIINSCNGIIHVDNPSITNNDAIEINKRRRETSRSILLDHLEKVCRQDNYYRLAGSVGSVGSVESVGSVRSRSVPTDDEASNCCCSII